MCYIALSQCRIETYIRSDNKNHRENNKSIFLSNFHWTSTRFQKHITVMQHRIWEANLQRYPHWYLWLLKLYWIHLLSDETLDQRHQGDHNAYELCPSSNFLIGITQKKIKDIANQYFILNRHTSVVLPKLVVRVWQNLFPGWT